MTVDYRVGDTRDVIATVDTGSVDLIATSPPFLALRSYVPDGHEAKGLEAGSEPNPAAFVDMLLSLTAEWGRVLAAHGSIAVELGDTYSGSGGAGGDYRDTGLRAGAPPFAGSAKFARDGRNDPDHPQPDLFKGGGPGGRGWPRAKSLALVPQLYAVALAYGINPLTGEPSPAGRWLVRNVIVWHRTNPSPGALGDKVRPSTSYIVVATQSPTRWFDLTAIRTVPSQPDNPRRLGTVDARERARVDVGLSSGNGWTGTNPAGAPPLDAWFDTYDGTHDCWTLTTQPSPLAHFAMWPARLAERLILSMCPLDVCRTCAQPRRRIEHHERTFGRVTASAGRSAAAQNGGPFGSDYTVTTQTLGWSDCGHDNWRHGLTLDPFAGTGTTLAVADVHGRDAIGIDFDHRNRDLYPRRYDEVKRALFGTTPELPGQLDLFDLDPVATPPAASDNA